MSTECSTLALVEGPAQLLDVIELAHACEGGDDLGELRVAVLAPALGRGREQLRGMVALARQEGLAVSWHEPRSGGASVARTVRNLLDELGPTRRLVVADPFSGVAQVLISLVRPTDLTVVDDGGATAELVQHLAGLRLRRASEERTRLRVFTSVPRGAVGPEPLGVEVRRNDYAWLRGRWPGPEIHDGADLVGAPLVEAGEVAVTAYLAAVERLVAQQGVTRYLAHRGESDDKLEQVRGLGVDVDRPTLPLEIAVRRGPVGATVIAFPSVGVHTLPVVLAGSGVRTLLCGVADRQARAVC
ncbi:hypothetical protein GCM10022197_33250 [Microlunatus spumicola]|uniref:Uncharacterized protein n=1 Tax=Microlunatus spumicola TaxID=81499 RepID=A0ABP6XWK6_9ACTN